MAYAKAAGRILDIPERPLEPREDKYIAAVSHEDDVALLDKFCVDHPESLVAFLRDYDSTILWDFVESLRWKWNQYKEENRIYE